MRLLDIFNRHPRADISAHADGELAPDRLRALETHLAGCERCHTELDELLALRIALRDLPQVAAPRSFTLTPAMAEREPPPVTSRTTPSFVAMRVAGAGFAAVLAVVVMLDAGGIVDDTGGDDDDDSSAAIFEADPTNRAIAAPEDSDADEFNALSEATDIPADVPNSLGGGQDADGEDDVPTAGGTDGGVGGVGGAPASDGDGPAAGGGVGGPDGLEDAPDDRVEDPALEPLDAGSEPGTAEITPDDGDDSAAAGPDSGEGAPESGDGAAAAFSPEDDGVSALLVIEIGLAVVAVLAIGGSFVVRRRSENE